MNSTGESTTQVINGEAAKQTYTQREYDAAYEKMAKAMGGMTTPEGVKQLVDAQFQGREKQASPAPTQVIFDEKSYRDTRDRSREDMNSYDSIDLITARIERGMFPDIAAALSGYTPKTLKAELDKREALYEAISYSSAFFIGRLQQLLAEQLISESTEWVSGSTSQGAVDKFNMPHLSAIIKTYVERREALLHDESISAEMLNAFVDDIINTATKDINDPAEREAITESYMTLLEKHLKGEAEGDESPAQSATLAFDTSASLNE